MPVRLADIVPELGTEPRRSRSAAPSVRAPQPAAQAPRPVEAKSEPAAFERGRREGLAAATREHERERAQADARLQEAVAAARQAATLELGQALAGRIDAAIRALEERLASGVIDALEPILAARLAAVGRQEFVAAVARAVAIGPAVKVRLRGPAEIVAAISQGLATAGVAHEALVAASAEVTADVDDLRVRASLDALVVATEELVG